MTQQERKTQELTTDELDRVSGGVVFITPADAIQLGSVTLAGNGAIGGPGAAPPKSMWMHSQSPG